jgi:hypothetical protein
MSAWWYVLVSAGMSGPATVHTLRLRRHVRNVITSKATQLDRMIDDQRMHALQLWPRPWPGASRPLTQAEQIIDQNKGYMFPGMPYPPEEQLQRMYDDADRLLRAYRSHDEKKEDKS